MARVGSIRAGKRAAEYVDVLSRPKYVCAVSRLSYGAATTKWQQTSRCFSSFRPLATDKAKGLMQFKLGNTHSELRRDDSFSQVTKEDVEMFRSIIKSDSGMIETVTSSAGQEDITPYNRDWLNKYQGHTKVVLKPESTEQVSKICKYCNHRSLAVVPQGGNTGLVGGSVPVFDEIVLSLARMNQIQSFDPVSGILVADAGVILETADKYLAEQGHIFPLDLGAKGSCHIGGNVATNAGGLRLLRYGSLHGTVLGIEAVLPDGTIVDDLSRLRKNNTGYDLKQLFIGSEGTLGIITAVSVLCPQRSPGVNLAYIGLESYEKVLETFVEAKKKLGEILSAFELMDHRSQKIVDLHKQSDQAVLESDWPFYCLIETSGSNAESDYNRIEGFLEELLDKQIVADGTISQDQTQFASLWQWREGIPEALARWGACYKYDVSIPIRELYQLVDDTRAHLQDAGLIGDTDEYPAVDVVGYGHMGDGNLHLNIPARRYDPKVEQALEPFVYEWVAKQQGSISAEHGVGLAKKPFIGYSRSDNMLRLMRLLKKTFDPVSDALSHHLCLRVREMTC